MVLELRYGLGKVFVTQNHVTLGLASSHCVLYLNLIKDTLNIAYILTHTYTHTHTHTLTYI